MRETGTDITGITFKHVASDKSLRRSKDKLKSKDDGEANPKIAQTKKVVLSIQYANILE